MPHFNPRSPCGERQLRTAFQIQKFYISIHAPRAGERRKPAPTLPATLPNFNPRSPCGERLADGTWGWVDATISIHAPRAGSDPGAGSVPPGCCRDFNPRSPCGERPLLTAHQNRPDAISIHAPRAGSDVSAPGTGLSYSTFQSTLPRAGSDSFRSLLLFCCYISIHAPRAGSDHADVMHWFPIHDFNPRSPCGERPLSITGARRTDPYFNPRSPCGGATLRRRRSAP